MFIIIIIIIMCTPLVLFDHGCADLSPLVERSEAPPWIAGAW